MSMSKLCLCLECMCFVLLRSPAVSVVVPHWDRTEVSLFCLVHQTSSRWLVVAEAVYLGEGQADEEEPECVGCPAWLTHQVLVTL